MINAGQLWLPGSLVGGNAVRLIGVRAVTSSNAVSSRLGP